MTSPMANGACETQGPFSIAKRERLHGIRFTH
jgi:hypothetical protein